MVRKPKLFDLEERTALFGAAVMKFCKQISADSVSRLLISQLIRLATSIGANYMKANGASSRKDLDIKFTFVRRKLKKQCIGLECYLKLSLAVKKS